MASQWIECELSDLNFFFFVFVRFVIERMETKRIFVNRILIFLAPVTRCRNIVYHFGHFPVCRLISVSAVQILVRHQQPMLIFLRKMNKKRLHMEHKRKSRRFCIVPKLEDRFGHHVQILAFNTVFNSSSFPFISFKSFEPESTSDVGQHVEN